MFFQNLFAPNRALPSSETFTAFLSALASADELAAAGGIEKHGDTLPVSLQANPPSSEPTPSSQAPRRHSNKKSRRDPSILISADGLVLDEQTTTIVKSLDTPSKPPAPSPSYGVDSLSLISQYDSLRVGSDEPNGDYLANGFSMHSLPQTSVTR